MYNQNQIRMCNGYWGSRIEFEMCDEFKNGRITIDIRVMPEIIKIMSMARKEKNVYDAVKSVYTYFVKNFDYAYNLGTDLKYHSAVSVFMYKNQFAKDLHLHLPMCLIV